jgi:hypothetical protein
MSKAITFGGDWQIADFKLPSNPEKTWTRWQAVFCCLRHRLMTDKKL